MAVIATGLDYSARRIAGASIRAAGHRFVIRYLWFPGQGHAYLTADEYRDLTANGIEVHAVYEENTSDPAGGWAAGVRMGKQAVASARDAGLPAGRTIYMCADAWLSSRGISVSTAMQFLDGARSVINPAGYLTGAYGFSDFIYAAQDGGRADRFWLAGAESGVRPGIHHYQWNNGSVTVDGVTCDLNKQYLSMFDGAPGGGGVGGDFLMALSDAEQRELLDTAREWKAGIPGQRYGGGAWWAWQQLLEANAGKLDAIGAAVQQLHDDPGSAVQLTPEQVAALQKSAADAAREGSAEAAKAIDQTVAGLRSLIQETDTNDPEQLDAALRAFFGRAMDKESA